MLTFQEYQRAQERDASILAACGRLHRRYGYGSVVAFRALVGDLFATFPGDNRAVREALRRRHWGRVRLDDVAAARRAAERWARRSRAGGAR